MRVLLTTHQFFPRWQAGTEVLTRDHGLELLRRGHDVSVITTDPGARSPSSWIEADDYTYRGLKVRSLKLPDPPQAEEALAAEYQNPAVADHLRLWLDEVQPDLVHAFHLAKLSGSALDAFAERQLPVVVTATDFWSICGRNILAKPSGELCGGPDEISSNCLECRLAENWFQDRPDLIRRGDFYREIAEQALSPNGDDHPNLPLVRTALARTEYLARRFNAVEAILVPTELMRDTLVANGISADRIRVSPFGMNTRDAQTGRELRQRSETLRVGYIGTISKQKGLDVLLSAFELLHPDLPVSLRICGNLETYPDFGRTVYRRAHADPRISFAGGFPNERIGDELAKIDVLAVPSTWYENSPLVIYSAFAAGAPVVATDLGGMSELVHEGENGLLFEVGDATKLARQLERLATDRELLDRLREGTSQPRTVEDSVDEITAIYEDLVEVPSPNPIPAAGAAQQPEKTRGIADVDQPALMETRGLGSPLDRSAGARSALPSRRVGPAGVPTTTEARVNGRGGPRPETALSSLFFLMGRAKSGTSWLMRMLDAHPEIVCKGEGQFFGRAYRRGDAAGGGQMQRRSLYGALADNPDLRAWFDASVWTRNEDTEQQLAELTAVATRHFLAAWVSEEGTRIVGDKTPFTAPDVIEEIARIVPEAKVVHIIRDGRDVAVSSIHHIWNHAADEGGIHTLSAQERAARDEYREDPDAFRREGRSIFTEKRLRSTAKNWATMTASARADGTRLLGSRYVEVRYEDLLAEPEGEAERMLAFLGASTSRAAVSRCVKAASFERWTKGRRAGEEDSTAFLRKGVAGDWRNVFSERDRQVFKEEAGELLIELGYEESLDW